MEAVLHEDKTFDNIDYSEKELSGREFNGCTFNNCNFSKSDLSNNDFIDCTMNDCNLSLGILKNASLNGVEFINCKLMGIDFGVCNDFLFAVNFDSCNLEYSTFFKRKMKKTSFKNCSLKEVDFAEVDLSMSVFKNCDLLGATFAGTNLEKVDFRTAINYSFDPALNRMKQARFSHLGLSGLLAKYNIQID